jgi:predicted membrane-bound mannosyltransferase
MGWLKHHRFLLSIIVIGLSLRVTHLFFFSSSPLFIPNSLDELYHHLWAQRISEGHIDPSGAFFRAPFYPYLLALFYKIFGSNDLTPRLIGLLSGLLPMLSVYHLAKILTDNKKTALVACFLSSLSVFLIYFESRILLDSLLVPFSTIFLYFLVGYEKDKKLSNLLGAGFFSGLYAITRPNNLPFFFASLIYLLFLGFFEKNSGLSINQKFRNALNVVIFYVIPFALVIAPVTVNNFRMG